MYDIIYNFIISVAYIERADYSDDRNRRNSVYVSIWRRNYMYLDYSYHY